MKIDKTSENKPEGAEASGRYIVDSNQPDAATREMSTGQNMNAQLRQMAGELKTLTFKQMNTEPHGWAVDEFLTVMHRWFVAHAYPILVYLVINNWYYTVLTVDDDDDDDDDVATRGAIRLLQRVAGEMPQTSIADMNQTLRVVHAAKNGWKEKLTTPVDNAVWAWAQANMDELKRNAAYYALDRRPRQLAQWNRMPRQNDKVFVCNTAAQVPAQTAQLLCAPRDALPEEVWKTYYKVRCARTRNLKKIHPKYTALVGNKPRNDQQQGNETDEDVQHKRDEMRKEIKRAMHEGQQRWTPSLNAYKFALAAARQAQERALIPSAPFCVDFAFVTTLSIQNQTYETRLTGKKRKRTNHVETQSSQRRPA